MTEEELRQLLDAPGQANPAYWIPKLIAEIWICQANLAAARRSINDARRVIDSLRGDAR